MYNKISEYNVSMDNYTLEQNPSSQNEIIQCNVLFQEAAAAFYDNGFSITSVDDAINIGFIASKEYSTIQDFNTDIESLYKDELIGLNGKAEISESLLSKTYIFRGSVKYLLDPDMASLTDKQKQILESIGDSSSLRADVKMVMPGAPIELGTGENKDGGANYFATYNNPQDSEILLATEIQNTTIKILILVAVIIAAVVGFFFYSKARKKKKEQKLMEELYGPDEDENEE